MKSPRAVYMGSASLVLALFVCPLSEAKESIAFKESKVLEKSTTKKTETADDIVAEILEQVKTKQGAKDYWKNRQHYLNRLSQQKQPVPEAFAKLINSKRTDAELDVLTFYILPISTKKNVDISNKSITGMAKVARTLLEKEKKEHTDFNQNNPKKRLIMILGHLGPRVPEVEETIYYALEDDQNPYVQSYSIRALSNLVKELDEKGQKRATRLFLKMLNSDVPDLRSRAAYALKDCKQLQDLTIPALVTALEDNYLLVRRAAAFSLRNFGPNAKAAIPLLAKAAKSETDRNMKSYSVHALRSIGHDDPKVVRIYLEFLDIPDLELAALNHMWGFKNTANFAASRVVKYLTSEDRKKRRYATICLGYFGNKEVLPALEEALQDEDALVRKGAKFAIRKLATSTSEQKSKNKERTEI